MDLSGLRRFRTLRGAIVVSSDRYAVETSIVDSGPGVPLESQPRLFGRSTHQIGRHGTRAGVQPLDHRGAPGFDRVRESGRRRLPILVSIAGGRGMIAESWNYSKAERTHDHAGCQRSPSPFTPEPHVLLPAERLRPNFPRLNRSRLRDQAAYPVTGCRCARSSSPSP